MNSDAKVEMTVKPIIPSMQIPGIYHRMVGDIVVSTISDGYLNGDVEGLIGIETTEAKDILGNAYRPVRRTSVNCFLVFSGEKIALIDTGCGDYMGPTAGRLFDNLKVMGISTDDIDTVLLTHLHPDHVGGLVDKETGRKNFPNAEIGVYEKEFGHWFNSEAQAQAEGMQGFFFGIAQNHLGPYKDDALRVFSQGEVFPGIHAIESPGHTPGHTVFLIESGSEQLIVWGDTIHVQEIQIRHPEVGINFDTDQVLAAQSRQKLFNRAASEEILTGGMHTHFPGFGRLRQAKTGFDFHQEAWVQDLRGTEI